REQPSGIDQLGADLQAHRLRIVPAQAHEAADAIERPCPAARAGGFRGRGPVGVLRGSAAPTRRSPARRAVALLGGCRSVFHAEEATTEAPREEVDPYARLISRRKRPMVGARRK